MRPCAAKRTSTWKKNSARRDYLAGSAADHSLKQIRSRYDR